MQLWSLRHFLLTALYSKSPKNAEFTEKNRYSVVWIVVKRVGRWNKIFTAYHILILQFECHQIILIIHKYGQKRVSSQCFI